MTLETVQLGDRRRVTVTFKDEADALTDPTTVTARVCQPDGTIVDLTGTSALTNPSPGVWSAVLPRFDTPGLWRWRVAGQGSIDEAIEGTLYVSPSKFPIEA